MTRPMGLPQRVTVALLIGAIILDVTYWSLWWAARSVVASEHTSAYYQFENAFPLADAWLGIACVAALVALRRFPDRAAFWITAAGGAGLYLFGMDFLYDVEHGIFFKGGAGAFEAVIVGATLVFSIMLLRYAWRRETTGTQVRTAAARA